MTTTGTEVRTIETSTATISYRDMGDGPVVLCLHGGGPGATAWGNFSRNAEDLSANFRVIVPDQPGFGESRLNKDNGYSYKRVSAEAMAEFLTALDIDKAHLIGNSMGGGVALTMAMRYPDQVGRLALMGPWYPGFGVRVYSMPSATNLQEYYPDPSMEKMQALISAFVHNPNFPGREELAKSRYEATLRPEIREGYLRMSTGTDPDDDARSPFERIAAVTNETLLVWGRDDRFCSLDEAFLYLEALRNSRLLLLRDTGHWAQIEQRENFATHVDAFFGS
jgi:2-hydroxy-6-oxonona-2,4-dienedioate hydrolase/4,5:9,10-diseco-3-hydroxy-5,9,17-trioxoandrosta-1(10),2-diene-4-oate hydrolase